MKTHHAKSHGESIAGKTCECELCGDDFNVDKDRVEEARFCSLECKGEWQSENIVGENHPSYNGGNVSLECEVCGDTYEVEPYKEEESRFCSYRCMGEGYSENLVGKNNPFWKGGNVLLECEQCGDEFKVKSAVAERRRFCSRECMGESRFQGEFRYGSGWNNKKRHRVRKRDDFKCQECGITQDEHIEETSQKLHVHHRIPARKFDDPHERNAMSNLTTLCQRCHRKVESRD